MIREFVMHGQHVDNWRTKVNLSSYFFSEKLDGMRCIWVPHTRGMLFKDVPFANKFKDDRNLVCTGLWSRKAKIIHCPDWFVSGLPQNYILDGELFGGRGEFQATISATRKLIPIDSEWDNIKFNVFDIPTANEFYSGGKIRFDKGCYLQMPGPPFGIDYSFQSFEHVKFRIEHLIDSGMDHLGVVEQQTLPLSQNIAIDMLTSALNNVFDLGGEGLMLRHRIGLWKPKRCDLLIKMVDCLESSGQVVGWNPGKDRLIGKLGSLKIKWEDKEFDLSGFTDTERLLNVDGSPIFFKLGQQVKFKYRELTDDNVPKQPRYSRSYIGE